MRLRWMLVVGSWWVAGCGLDTSGLGAPQSEDAGVDARVDPPDAGAADVAPESEPPAPDAGVDATPEAGFDAASWPCGVNPGACAILPAGFVAKIVATTQVSCPLDFGSELHPVGNAQPQAGACTCTVDSNTLPDCYDGSIATYYDVGIGGCNLTSASLTVKGSGCQAVGGGLANHFKGSPAAPKNAACTASPTLNPAKLTYDYETTCAPTTCAERVCAGVAPPGFAACIEHDGDVPCPSAFAKKQLVGDAAQLGPCGPCGCTAQNAACTNATIQFFTDKACANSIGSYIVDNKTCSNAPPVFQGFASFSYSASPSASFVAGTSPPSVAYTKPRTVCCK